MAESPTIDFQEVELDFGTPNDTKNCENKNQASQIEEESENETKHENSLEAMR